MSRLANHPTAHFLSMLGVALAVGAAFWIADGVRAAVPPTVALIALALIVHVGRRHSDAMSAIAGFGDERERALGQRAAAFAGNTMAWVIAGWWLVSVADGEANQTLGVLGAVFGVSYIAGAVVAARGS